MSDDGRSLRLGLVALPIVGGLAMAFGGGRKKGTFIISAAETMDIPFFPF